MKRELGEKGAAKGGNHAKASPWNSGKNQTGKWQKGEGKGALGTYGGGAWGGYGKPSKAAATPGEGELRADEDGSAERRRPVAKVIAKPGVSAVASAVPSAGKAKETKTTIAQHNFFITFCTSKPIIHWMIYVIWSALGLVTINNYIVILVTTVPMLSRCYRL